ncbi:calcyphosin-like protein [Stomoxys calcitrans]|uniref:EF-hand domain-containing protein n=1 Tax=Stomoxys calcitrans TaxID=35570 RepID=A0A1I8NZZ4_STOCA|nr:calcyphosin-like protein [Stomoxys calcitrans]
MSFRDDFYLKEATLVNRARRELANGLQKDPIENLRLLCFAHGVTGILKLSRALRSMENDGTKTLNFEEFKAAMQKSGMGCSENEIKELFDGFVDENKGVLSTNDFLAKVRPAMTRSRLEVIEKAFAKADPTGNGVIFVGDLKHIYNVKDHPKYLSGELTEKEILTDFLNNFRSDNGKFNDGKIYKEEFINYYSSVSASIERDAYFDLVMRRAYKL